MSCFVQTAGAVHLRLGRAERRVVWGHCHWKRKQSDELLLSPPRRKVGTRRASWLLPYHTVFAETRGTLAWGTGAHCHSWLERRSCHRPHRGLGNMQRSPSESGEGGSQVEAELRNQHGSQSCSQAGTAGESAAPATRCSRQNPHSAGKLRASIVQ